MQGVPFHPVIIHFPLAITFILPVLVLVFALFIKNNKMAPKAWLIIIGLQLFTTVTGYISLESGEKEEDAVEKVVEKKFIHEHEEAAEIFVGSTVLALVIGIAAFFVKRELQFILQMVIVAISLVSCFLAYRTGKLGGELIYQHGAAAAYGPTLGILPTPGKNTSESTFPVDENESVKSDEHDYGNADEGASFEDEDLKQED